MECPNCAGENRDTAHFCNRCGQRLDSTSAIMANSSSHEYVSLPEQLVSGIVQILDADENISGTGFVVSQAGLIATCSHVIQTKKLQLDNKRHPEKVTIVFQAISKMPGSRATGGSPRILAISPSYISKAFFPKGFDLFHLVLQRERVATKFVPSDFLIPEISRG